MEPSNRIGIGFGIMLLNKDRQILLGKRHFDPAKADSELRGEGTWTMPGGKLEYGESFEEGAARELLEETGMILKSFKIICVNNDKNEHAHFVTLGFFSDDFEGEPNIMEPDEITEWVWFNLNNLPSPIFFPSKNIIDSYNQKKFTVSK